MLVMFRIAQQMLTGIIEAGTIDFTHSLCEGRLKKGATGIFGNTGGTFFSGNFGEHEGKPHTVDFFIPRYASHLRLGGGIVTMTRYDPTTGTGSYPYDVDLAGIAGSAKIRTVKH